MVSTAKLLNRPALAASLLVTLTALALELSGALDRLEGMTLTQRFAYARWSPHPLDGRIALVAIDDSSEEAFGRWPWARSLQAKAIDEIRRAGAKTVAFDVIYNTTSADPAEDEALAGAIRRCGGVVAAYVDPDDLLSELWKSGSGAEVLRRLLTTLGDEIELPKDEVVKRVGLSGAAAERFLAQPMAFRTLAAWQKLQLLRSEDRRPADFDAFMAALGAPVRHVQGTSAERKVLSLLWQRDRSWEALARFMPPTSGEPSPREAPPILPVAEAAGGAGMVKGDTVSGGETRRVMPAVPTPVGDCLQLGIAAAAHFMGVDPASVSIEGSRVRVGDASIPVEHGQIIIDWPTATFRGFPSVRGGGTPCEALPLGTLAGLADQRALQDRQETTYREVAAQVAANLSRSAGEIATLPMPEKLRADLREMVEFNIPDLFAKGLDALPPDASEDERGVARLYLQWDALEKAVLEGRAALHEREETIRTALDGRLVLVGHVATGALADMINSPYGPRTPGVFVHAAIANMVLGSHGIRSTPSWVGPVMTLLLGVVCGVIAAALGAGRGSLLALLVLVLSFGVAWFAFGWASILVPMVAPLSGGFASWVAGVTMVAVISQRERARVTRQFRARVSPQLVERLAANPDALSVGGLEREVTILFGDLAGFTTISEQLEGPEVVRTLNRYMGALTQQLTARRAYVNKFLGDGLLAFWSAFGEEPEQRRLAAEAAAACQEAVVRLGEAPEFRGRPPIRLRLGIATGEVVVGDCGAPPELNDYTVIGDAVNLASRLESANKQFGTRILMDGTTAAGIPRGAGAPVLLGLGRVVVVGQSVPVEVFTVVDAAAPPGWIEAIEQAVAVFRGGDRAAALDAWREVDRRFDHPALAKPFLAVLQDPEEPCDGVLRLRAK